MPAFRPTSCACSNTFAPAIDPRIKVYPGPHPPKGYHSALDQLIKRVKDKKDREEEEKKPAHKLTDLAYAKPGEKIPPPPDPMDDPHAIHPGAGAGHVERLSDVRRLHRRPQRPREDVARVVVEHRRQVVPTPSRPHAGR